MATSIKTIIKILLQRRERTLPAVYGIAGFVLLILGLFGFEYGAPLLYWPFALLCFSLIVYPTLLSWGLIAGIYSGAALTYVIFTISEFIIKGKDSTIYSDGLLVYFIYVSIIIAIAAGLVFSKPSKINE